MVQWSDAFWGEGNRGLEALSNNVKYGAIVIEEFQRFLNESAQCELIYHKNLSRLQSQLLKFQYVGTFTPIWNLIRDLFDKISSIHSVNGNFYQELLRDIHSYQELYNKKFKNHIQKDADITRTADLLSNINNLLNSVNKAKEQCYSISLDLERSKRSGYNVSNNSTTSIPQDNNSINLAQSAINSIATRQTERLERKFRQAQDDYKLMIEKYNLVRTEYEKRFYDACEKFQNFEIDYIERMLVFSLNYSEILQRTNEKLQAAHVEFNEKIKSLSGSTLLDMFVEQKKTGTDRPVPLQFEEFGNNRSSTQLLNSITSDLSNSQDDSSFSDQNETNVPSFQLHFSVPLQNTKSQDQYCSQSPIATTKQTHSSLNILTGSPSTPPINPMISNTTQTRSHETTNNSDQTFNPFNVKIRRPKFPGFFGPNRKELKNKKNEKKTSNNSKLNKKSKIRQKRDRSVSNNNEDANRNLTTEKNKSLTPEPDIHSDSLISDNDVNRHVNQNAIPFPTTSKISKSTSSSDTSDDDDPMFKIDFKINPKSQVLSESNDETTISNAMRLIDKNIGNFSINPRKSPSKSPDIDKSISSGQIGTDLFSSLPPPPFISPRPASTLSNTLTNENIDHLNIFPPHDQFIPRINVTSHNGDKNFNDSHSAFDKSFSSLSYIDDDTEVANSFPNDDSTNRTSSISILQETTNQQPTTLTNHSPRTSNIPTKSPIIIGAMEQIPLAIAFQETIHLTMSGDKQENYTNQIVGEMLISFPASILNLFVDPSSLENKLEFRLKNIDNIQNINVQSTAVTENESIYSFDMIQLNNILRNLQEKHSSSIFFNLNILNYEIKQFDVSNIPIKITSQWSRTFDTISVNINYQINSSAFPESIRIKNDLIIFYTIINDGQQIKESTPNAEWSADEHKLWWKIPYVINGSGNLSATVTTIETETKDADNQQQQQQTPISVSSIVNAHFVGENALFSSIDFDLLSNGYRVSLFKKQILIGKYQSIPDQYEPIHLFQRPVNSSTPSSTF